MTSQTDTDDNLVVGIGDRLVRKIVEGISEAGLRRKRDVALELMKLSHVTTILVSHQEISLSSDST